MCLATPCYAHGQMLSIAIPKGRISEQAGDLLLMLGVGVRRSEAGMLRRALLLRTTSRSVAVVVWRCHDIVGFVMRGYVCAGFVGGDVVRESRLCVPSPVDLRISPCRLSLALRRQNSILQPRKLRVATKYPNAVKVFLGYSESVAYVSLRGGMEAAPLLGAAEVVADIVDTGSTLAANGLSEVRRMAPVTARIVLNECIARLRPRAMRVVTDMLRLATAYL
ncbi:ATP phosphoribosyltransferase [Candidatus Tremblaya princeps]|nr:ATP phosphoribosyltransferase [Candidatus Tremblaya princeps]